MEHRVKYNIDMVRLERRIEQIYVGLILDNICTPEKQVYICHRAATSHWDIQGI